MKSILITDSQFILPEHEEKLSEAGFEIERLNKPQATEEELIEALKGKDGYVLGGIETLRPVDRMEIYNCNYYVF